MAWGYGPPLGILETVLVLLYYFAFKYWFVVVVVVAVGSFLLVDWIRTKRKERAAQGPDEE